MCKTEMLYRLDPNELQIDPVNVRLQKALSGSDRGVEAARKAIDFYQACINAYAILTAVGNEPLYQLLNTVGMYHHHNNTTMHRITH